MRILKSQIASNQKPKGIHSSLPTNPHTPKCGDHPLDIAIKEIPIITLQQRSASPNPPPRTATHKSNYELIRIFIFWQNPPLHNDHKNGSQRKNNLIGIMLKLKLERAIRKIQ
ncbi:hypothetical protein [Stenotrophomonas sp. WZN-1]|uniref:hypothetical protein n=1 Tax=Stenotrophomonas sp. WZN-1 TaxID=2005046 RepID=UPI0012FE139F|nr:hypothetical protein [Stenotrophomonas sp. WZN-1]